MSKKMSKCCRKSWMSLNKLCKRVLNAFDFPPRFIDFRTFKCSKIWNDSEFEHQTGNSLESDLNFARLELDL